LDRYNPNLPILARRAGGASPSARLSPLGHDHINMLGRYAFTLPARVARGELRPLRDPNQLVDEAA
jgi:hypothetical protein